MTLPDHQQFIPGPQESEAVFLERAQQAGGTRFPPELQPVLDRTLAHFDVAPSWIPVTYSNRRLAPWHGGVMDPETGLQLRRAFRKQKRYLGIYSREEIVAHELIHAGRIAFNEPKFEEFFAYQLSASPLRRFLGPMIERPWEVWALLGSVLLPLFVDYACLATGWWAGFRLLMPLKALPGFVIGAGIWRSISKHLTLSRLLKKLEKLTGSPSKARAVAYRLSDAEIIRFSKRSPDQMGKAIKGAKGIRFEMIRTHYLAR